MRPEVEEYLATLQDDPDHVRSVIFLRGMPGSGKTTCARGIEAWCQMFQLDCEVCSAESHFADVDTAEDAFDLCYQDFLAFMGDGINVIVVDNMNLDGEFGRFRDDAELFEYNVQVFEFRAADRNEALAGVLRSRSVARMSGLEMVNHNIHEYQGAANAIELSYQWTDDEEEEDPVVFQLFGDEAMEDQTRNVLVVDEYEEESGSSSSESSLGEGSGHNTDYFDFF